MCRCLKKVENHWFRGMRFASVTIARYSITSVRRGGTVPWPPSHPKNKKCINSIRQCILLIFGNVYQNV